MRNGAGLNDLTAFQYETVQNMMFKYIEFARRFPIMVPDEEVDNLSGKKINKKQSKLSSTRKRSKNTQDPRIARKFLPSNRGSTSKSTVQKKKKNLYFWTMKV